MLKKSTKEIIGYIAFAVAFLASLAIVVYALHVRADLMGLSGLLLPLVMVILKQRQRTNAKRREDNDTLTCVQKCDLNHEEILASGFGNVGSGGDVDSKNTL